MHITNYGSIKVITYPDECVNSYSTQNFEKDANKKTEMQHALVRAGIDSSTFEGEKQNSIIEKAILLDSFAIPEEDAKSVNSAMMHSLYSVADIGEGPELLKLYIEELNDVNSEGTIIRAYQLQNIENQQSNDRVQEKSLAPSASTADVKIVADLFKVVKQKDKNFTPNPSSLILNKDETPDYDLPGFYFSESNINPFRFSSTKKCTSPNGIYNVGKIKEAEIPLSGSKAGQTNAGGTTSNNNITYPEECVNSYSTQNFEKDANKKTEMQHALVRAGIDSSTFEGEKQNSIQNLTPEQTKVIKESEGLTEGDAGGYNISKGDGINGKEGEDSGRTFGVFEGNRNTGRGNTEDKRNLSITDSEMESDAINTVGDERIWGNSKRSNEVGLERLAQGPIAENETSREETDGRRFLIAVKKGDLTTARELVDRQAERNGFELHEYGVLKSSKSRKIEEESARLRNMGWDKKSEPNSPSSTISVANLLDIVKQKFSDVLPLSVLEHYGVERKNSYNGEVQRRNYDLKK